MKAEERKPKQEKFLQKIKLKPDPVQGDKEAQAKLHAFLKERSMNETPERKFILWVIYHLDGPFDIDTLHAFVCEHKSQVCRTTIYNSLMIFEEAGLVTRFQPFANSETMYFEKALGTEPHGYQVCQKCGAIKVIDIGAFLEHIEPQINSTFHIAQFSFFARGLCKSCHDEERRRLKDLKRELKAKDIAKAKIRAKAALKDPDKKKSAKEKVDATAQKRGAGRQNTTKKE